MPATLDTDDICRNAMAWLATHDVVAVLMLDENLVVQASHGHLAEQVPAGLPIDEGLPLLAGLAPDLLNLQDEPEAVFALGNVGLAGPDGTGKINIEAFWVAEERHYYVLLHKLGLKTEPEAEIVKQARARRLAEDHLQRARQDLASQTSLLAAVADRAPLALAIIGAQGEYELATEAWRRLFGLPGDGVGAGALGDVPATASLGPHLDRVFAGQSVACERLAVPIGGQVRHIAFRAAPIERNGAPGAILVARDLDGRDAEIDCLRARIAHLEQANRSLEDFVATVAHDLEAPRRAIDRGLASPGAPDTQQIASASLRLHRMLADLMEHARAGAGGSTAEAVDIAAITRDALAATPGGDRYQLLCDVSERPILALRVPLEIVLRNLVANAVRHHDLATGTISLGLESDDKLWRMTVADDGPGIPQSERPHVFEPFRRLATRSEGTGLGLSIVATAVRRLGGTVEIRADGSIRGTGIIVTWPRHPDQTG